MKIKSELKNGVWAILFSTSMSAPGALAYSPQDWVGAWSGEGHSENAPAKPMRGSINIDEFDNKFIYLGEFDWWESESSEFSFTLPSCFSSAISKDNSKVLFKTENCPSPSFNGTTMICALKGATSMECISKFGRLNLHKK